MTSKTTPHPSIIKLPLKMILLALLVCMGNLASGQNMLPVEKDSLIKPIPMNVVIENLVSSRMKNSKTNLENNQTIRSQNNAFYLINIEIQKANNILERGFDYKGFTKEINLLVKWKDFAVDGITKNKNKRQTTGDLTTTSLLLNELVSRTKNQIDKIKNNNKALSDIQKRIDSLASDKALYKLPKDSIAMNNYFQRLVFLTQDIDKTNNGLKNAIDSIQTLEIKGDIFKNNLISDIVKVDVLRKMETDSLFSRRVSVFDAKDIKEKSFGQELKLSLKKGYYVLKFYVVNNSSVIKLLFLCILGISIYLKILKRKYKKANIYNNFKYSIQIFRRPLATATLITISIGQLFIPSPPFIFSAILWIIASIAITDLIKRETDSTLPLKTWLVYLVLILLVIMDNLILVQTLFETFAIIGMGVAATAYGLYRIYSKQKVFNTPTLWIVVTMLVFEILGVFFMVYGNYNLSKILVSVGIITILIGYLTIYTFQLTNDIFNFTNQIIESDTQKEINIVSRENHEIPKVMYFIFWVAWFIIINRNSYPFQNFMDPFVQAFSEEQKIGSFTYSYQSIFVFFFVIVVSVFISKIISFLASENKVANITEEKTSVGSWILLVRIAIIGIGITFAFAIAGIPTDRLTVIIGALGVGIGFGLQALVNNLISGLIIAFEKPVNLDDIVEIGGQTGTMKSIGIRSSVVTTWDGADIIIPNGDLLSKNLTNWTMGSSKRRYEIPVGVAYGTDLKWAKSILCEVLDKHPLILKNPEPMIWVTQFNDSSIDFVIKYWVPHFNYGNDVKTDLIIAIDEAFKANDIVIPFPQRDIHVPADTTSTKEA